VCAFLEYRTIQHEQVSRTDLNNSENRYKKLRIFLTSALRTYALEVTMGMGFPMGIGIPWDSHGNGNW